MKDGIRTSPLVQAGADRTSPARTWDEFAGRYDAYFAPRLVPWNDVAIAALTSASSRLPEGPLLVPCCGPGWEVERLAAVLPDHEVVGIDLSPEMVRLTQARCRDSARALVLCADASVLGPAWHGRAAGLLSCFGLQLLPAPDQSLADWAATLRPGGMVSVVFWPAKVEEQGPFALIGELLSSDAPPRDTGWESRLIEALRGVGLAVLQDELVHLEMRHDGAQSLWREFRHSAVVRMAAGPRGDDFLDAVGERFVRALGPGPITHHPAARHILARRPSK